MHGNAQPDGCAKGMSELWSYFFVVDNSAQSSCDSRHRSDESDDLCWRGGDPMLGHVTRL